VQLSPAYTIFCIDDDRGLGYLSARSNIHQVKAVPVKKEATRRIYSLTLNSLFLWDSRYSTWQSVEGTIGWSIEGPTPVKVLIDSGSDLSFISRKVLTELQHQPSVKKVDPITVRLTNGMTTVCEQTGAFGLTIQGYRSWTTLRILDWEAYDIILGTRLMASNGTRHR
jgi:hypothetical protein